MWRPCPTVETGKVADARGSTTQVLPTMKNGVLTTDQGMLKVPVAPTTGAKQKEQNSQFELPNNQLELLGSLSELITS